MTKKTPKILKISALIFTIVSVIFLWDYINTYKLWILIGSGAILLYYFFTGDFKFKKFFKGVKKRI